uniref:Kazal-like domain-containing protein n=1 Tax=Globodera pallida TaxID=36090 RepID=A0A183CDA4_GLOPA
MQTELDTAEGPSYLVNFSSSFERAKRELEILREHNANAEFVEMAKVLCIVSLFGLEIRLDTAAITLFFDVGQSRIGFAQAKDENRAPVEPETYSCVDEKGDQIFVVNSCVPDSGKCTHSDLDQICTKDGGTPKCEICYNGLCNKAKIELKMPLLKNVQKPNNPPKTGTDGAKNESSSEQNGMMTGAKNESSSEENGTSGAKNESSSTPAD